MNKYERKVKATQKERRGNLKGREERKKGKSFSTVSDKKYNNKKQKSRKKMKKV